MPKTVSSREQLLILGGADTGLVTSQMAVLVKEAIKLIMLGRLARATAQVFVLGLATAALATTLTVSGELARLKNFGGRRVAALGPVAEQPRLENLARRLDRFGDPLPSHAPLRLGTTHRRHTTGLAGLDFTRDGTAAVHTAQDDGLDAAFGIVASGREVRTVDMMADAATQDKLLRHFELSPDGNLMAAAGFAYDPAKKRIVHRVLDPGFENRIWRGRADRSPGRRSVLRGLLA